MIIKEFQNRIEAQREVLRIINSLPKYDEQLMGLSSKAIERWVKRNELNESHPVVDKIYDIAGRLFFLATKSQTPIDGNYEKVSADEIDAILVLRNLLDK